MLAETPDRAVELPGLANRAPQDMTGCTAHGQPLTALRHRLAAELDAEQFAAVWERGARLDLDTMVAQLLAELAAA